MKTIKCPKCREQTKLDIAHAVTSDGEVFLCDHCKHPFRYVEK